jgi:hypothetical protein
MKDTVDQLTVGVDRIAKQNRFALGSGLKTFSGRSSENPREFLTHFNSYALFCEWNEESKLNAFKLALIGQGNCWVEALLDAEKDTFEHLQTKFKLDYITNKQTDIVKKARGTKQKQGQSVEEYTYVMLNLLSSTEKSVADKVMYYVEGLLTPIRTHVMGFDPQTLQEAVQKAKIAEEIQRIRGDQSVATKSDFMTLQSTVSGLKSNLTEAFKKQAGVSVNYQRNNMNDRAMTSRTTDAQPRCHNCNMTGHLSPSCRKPPVCFRCKKPGHIMRNCRSQNGAVNYGVYSRNSNGQTQYSNRSEN